MSCCNPRAAKPGQRQVARPRGPRAQSVKQTYIVTWVESGQTQMQTFTGGRSDELAAERLSALKRGSIQRVTTPVVKPTEDDAKPSDAEVLDAVKAAETNTEPEEPKPAVKKAVAKKTTAKKGAAK